MSPKHGTIRARLTMMSALSSSFALLLACLAFLGYEFVTFRTSLVNDLTTDARTLAFNVTAPLLFDDAKAAATVLESLRAKPRIRSAIVAGRGGGVFAAYGEPVPPSVVARRPSAGLWYRFGSDGLLLGVPVLSEGSPIGALTLVASLDEHDRRIRQYLLLTGSVLLAALLAALAISSVLQRRILEPITRLTDAAGRVSRNADYSVRVGARTDDELGALAGTFDEMLARIEGQSSALRASEERYRRLFENSPLPMWVYDAGSLAFLDVNDAAVRHYGYSREEFLGMTIKDIRPQEEVAPLLERMSDRSDASSATQWRHVKKDGTRILVEVSSHAFSLGGREARLVLANDVTARERALEALRRSEARFARLLDAGIIGIIVADLRGNILEANDAFLRLVDRSGDDLRSGRVRWTDMTPAQWRPVDEEALHQLSPGGVARPFEKEYFRRDGTRVPVLQGAGMLDDTTFIGFVLDLTERKRLDQMRRDALELDAQNRRIQEANRLKSEFLANMSHELRTPLNSILGFGELLFDGEVTPDSPEHREFLGHIVKSGRHLLQLINDVLDLAKVEAGRLEFRPETIDLRTVIDEVMSITRATGEGKSIRMSTSVDRELEQGLLLDPARLKQVLYNFVSNALKFTPEGGSVVVRALAEGASSLRLEVEDTGPGIAPADIGRLFVEFQQLDSGLTKRHAGTGLGLALTKRLAEAQGGSVGVRSTLGQGSVFHAILPRRSPIGFTAPPPPRAAAAPGSPSVLVIEDDPRDQAQLVQALAGAGYAVESARTGSEALSLCSTRKFDAITLDLLLPDMGGQEVLRRVRASELNSDVPVVVATVATDRGAIAGFAVNDFLTKPIDPAALLSSLHRAGLQPGRPEAVLVVDDDEGSLELMAAALTRLGFRGIFVRGGEEALRQAETAPPAAVVLDLLMPGMDGFEFLDRLRASPTTHLTPVLVWTVKDLSAGEQERLSRSVQAIVHKGGGGIPALLDELRRFLSGRQTGSAGS